MTQFSEKNPESFGVPFPGSSNVQNLVGFIETQDFVPTAKPYNFFAQFVIVTASGSSRFYMYDTRGLAWKYTTLT